VYSSRVNKISGSELYIRTLIAFIFNAYMDGGAETNKIERRKIYKTEETI